MESANMQWPYIKELSSKLLLPYTRRVHLVNYSDPLAGLSTCLIICGSEDV